MTVVITPVRAETIRVWRLLECGDYSSAASDRANTVIHFMTGFYTTLPVVSGEADVRGQWWMLGFSTQIATPPLIIATPSTSVRR